MAKDDKKVSVRTVRKKLPSESVNLNDVAEHIAHYYNEYAQFTSDMPFMEEADVARIIDKLFEPEDVDFLMSTIYGQGLLAGACAVTFSMEELMNDRVLAMEEQTGEDLSAEAVGEIVEDSTARGIKKGGGGNGNNNGPKTVH